MGAAAGILALGLVPASVHTLGPANVAVRAAAGSGRTVVGIPPVGQVSARTHLTPLDLRIEFREVDFEALGKLATTEDGRSQLRGAVEGDVKMLLLRSALQFLLGAVVIGALAAMIILGRGLRITLASGSAALLLTAALCGLGAATYDLQAFENAEYRGSIARGRAVIDAVSENVRLLDELRSRFDVAGHRLSSLLLLLGNPDTDPREGATVLLHVSDIHANPLGLSFTQDLIEGFGADLVVDTGDLAASFLDTGELAELSAPLDKRLTKQIESLRVPYLFVPGNHDSPALVRAVDATENGTALDGTTTDVGGVSVLGWADPTYTTDTGVEEEDKAATRLTFADDVLAAVEDQAPQILAVHDVRLAVRSMGRVPLVLAGHAHERSIEEDLEETVVLTVGSTGATGLKSFTVETEEPYEAEVVYLRDGLPVAVDYVTLSGVGTDFQIDRRGLEPLDETLAGYSGD